MTLYLIEVSHRDGNYFAERTLKDLTREETIKDIRAGQVEDVNRVLRLNQDGSWLDATKEIAQAILDDLNETPHLDLQNFLEHALGCRTVASVMREMEAA